MRHSYLLLLFLTLAFCKSKQFQHNEASSAQEQPYDSNSILAHRVDWLTMFDSTVFLENERKAEWFEQYHNVLEHALRACPDSIRQTTSTSDFFCYKLDNFWRSFRFKKIDENYIITHDLILDTNLNLFSRSKFDDTSLYSVYIRAYNVAKLLVPNSYDLYFYPEQNDCFSVYAFPAFQGYDITSRSKQTFLVKIDSNGTAFRLDLPNSTCDLMGDTEEYCQLSLFVDDQVQPTLYQQFFARHFLNLWKSVKVFLLHNTVEYYHTYYGLKWEILPTTLDYLSK